MRNIWLVAVIFVLSLQSCSPDCKDVTLKKPVWNTRYEEYWLEKDTVYEKTVTIDTLVSYSMVKHQIQKTQQNNKYGELISSKVTHYLTIRNNSSLYSNSIAVEMIGEEYNEHKAKWSSYDRTTTYYTIPPNSNHTFSFTHSDLYANNRHQESDVVFKVLQRPTTISVTRQIVEKKKEKRIRRIDELTFRDTVVSNCECDIDALKAEFKAIQETYEKLKEEKLINE